MSGRRSRYAAPAPPDPGPGWLRSRFMRLPWPRPGHEAPKENSAWFIWHRSPLRVRHAPVVLYAPTNGAHERPYDAADDFGKSYDGCLRVVRERVAAGGKGWGPR